MTTISQEKQNRKRKFEEINIENEDEQLEFEDNNCTLNENVNSKLRFAFDIQTKLKIRNYCETSKITNSWQIWKHVQHKYPDLRNHNQKLD